MLHLTVLHRAAPIITMLDLITTLHTSYCCTLCCTFWYCNILLYLIVLLHLPVLPRPIPYFAHHAASHYSIWYHCTILASSAHNILYFTLSGCPSLCCIISHHAAPYHNVVTAHIVAPYCICCTLILSLYHCNMLQQAPCPCCHIYHVVVPCSTMLGTVVPMCFCYSYVALLHYVCHFAVPSGIVVPCWTFLFVALEF